MKKKSNKRIISRRTNLKIVLLVFLWLVFEILNYFLFPYFVTPLAWLTICVILLILLIRQIVKILREREKLRAYRITNLAITAFLFFLTFYNFNRYPTLIMEKIDWEISYHKRHQIVKKVKNGEIEPNSKWNNGIYHLPFEFPIVSNGGNDIIIYQNNNDKTTTVKFWTSRGFFSSPQRYFIYTNDEQTMKHYEELIIENPSYNRKIEKNWYKIIEL